jgi:hypothetical protein
MNYRASATAATRAIPIFPPPTPATPLAAPALDVVVVAPAPVAAVVCAVAVGVFTAVAAGVVVAAAVAAVVAAAIAVVLDLHIVPVFATVGNVGEALYVTQTLAQKAMPNETAAGVALA